MEDWSWVELLVVVKACEATIGQTLVEVCKPTIFLHDTPTHDNTPPYQVWLKMVEWCRKCRPDKIGNTGRRTDGRTDGQSDSNVLPPLPPPSHFYGGRGIIRMHTKLWHTQSHLRRHTHMPVRRKMSFMHTCTCNFSIFKKVKTLRFLN